jgi:uncharacterized protein (TIGR02145 family)
VSLSVTTSNADAYQWLKDGAPVTAGSGHNAVHYTTEPLEADATYKVVVGNAGACSITSNEAIVTIKKTGCCDAPGSTVTFTDFNPCTSVAVNSTWMLTDDRAEGNNQTYKVKFMGDGQYWMVQDLRYGTGCNKKNFAGSTGNKTGNVAPGHYGDCRFNDKNADAGYLYDWAAALNKPNAFQGSTANVGCSGTGSAANACKGICPEGWHVPTIKEFEDTYKSFQSAYGCSNSACWNNASQWEGVPGGASTASGLIRNPNSSYCYWSSTSSSANDVLYLSVTKTTVSMTTVAAKSFGLSIRCVKNE